MFLTILKFIWQLGIIMWITYSSFYTFRDLVIKTKDKRKE